MFSNLFLPLLTYLFEEAIGDTTVATQTANMVEYTHAELTTSFLLMFLPRHLVNLEYANLCNIKK